MKKKSFVFVKLACAWILLASSGCVKKTPQRVYCVGKEYEFITLSMKVGLDKEGQRFFIDYKFKEEGAKAEYFSFNFHFYSEQTSADKEEFRFLNDKDENITFDEFGTYEFKKSCSLYIYFDKSNDSIKKAIENNNYSLSISGKEFVPEQLISQGNYSEQ